MKRSIVTRGLHAFHSHTQIPIFEALGSGRVTAAPQSDGCIVDSWHFGCCGFQSLGIASLGFEVWQQESEYEYAPYVCLRRALRLWILKSRCGNKHRLRIEADRWTTLTVKVPEDEIFFQDLYYWLITPAGIEHTPMNGIGVRVDLSTAKIMI